MPADTKNPLEKLVGLAPKKEESGPPKRGKKTPPRGSQRSELGPLDMAKYLNHYGIQYDTKHAGGVTLYRLAQCIFDPNHKKNEAAINQAQDGLITYKCFHNACTGKQWTDARKVISGDENLARFCDGYDPEWKPRSRKGTGKVPDAVSQKDGKDFLVLSEKGRIKFIEAKMANYLEEKLKPIIFEGKHFSELFYKYDRCGVWRVYPADAIRLIVRSELGDDAKPGWIDKALYLLATQTFKWPEELEFDAMWLNLVNGMLNIESLEMRPHAPEFNSRVQLSVKYDDSASCPRWIGALTEIFADDQGKADVLQEFFGYCLYPKILFPAALFQIGRGGNGKGVVEKVLCAMLGKENISHISLARMEESFGTAEIKEKLLNSCGETEAKPLEVTNFKKVAAGDEVQAQVKYKNDIKFTPFAKHMISMNAFPGVKDKTDAFFRRVIVLEYNQKFEGKEDDKHLADKLLSELDGIFKWSLEGLKKVLKNEEIASPESVLRAKERFKERVNPVLSFVKEACDVDSETRQGGLHVLPAELYRKYQDWMEDAKLRPLGKQNFYEQILINHPVVKKLRKSYETREFFFGIRLRPEE